MGHSPRQLLVQHRGGVLQYKRGDHGLLDRVAASHPRHQGVVERVQSQGHPHGHRRRADLRFSVSFFKSGHRPRSVQYCGTIHDR